MADEIVIGALNIPVELDTSRIKRQAQGDLRRRMREAGETAGRDGGRAAGDAFMDGVRQRFRARMADAKEALARGMIDEREFARRGRAAAQALNREVLREMERLGRAGKLNQARFMELADSLKRVRQEGQAIGRSTQTSLQGLQSWVRGTFVVGFLALFSSMIGRATRMLRGLGRNAEAVLDLGGERTRTRREFGNVARERGLDPVQTTREMRAATRGMVDDLQIWRNAQTALLADLPVSTEALAEMAYMARRMGKDGSESFERLVEGIAKGEQGILEELRLMTRLETAVNDWARANGVNADSLTQTQKVGIFFNAVMEEMREKVALLGPDTLTAGQRLDQLRTFLTNVKSAAAEAIAETPALSRFLTGIGTDAESSAARVQQLANRIGALADTIADAGRRFADSSFGDVIGFSFRAMTGNWSSQAQAASRMTGLGNVFDQNLRRREIQSAETVADLDQLRLDRLTEIHRLMEADASGNRERIRQLRLELTLINSRRAAKKREQDETDDSTRPPAPEDPSVRQSRERIQQQIADSFFALGHSALEVELRALDQLEDKLRAVNGLTAEYARQIEALRQAARERAAFGELQGMLGSLPGEGPKRAAGLEELHRRAMDLLGTLQEGSPIWRELVAFLEEVEKQSRAAAEGLKAVDQASKTAGDKKLAIDASVNVDAARDHARAIEQGVRGALQLAEALGRVDDEMSQSLQGAAQLAAALVEISALMKAGQTGAAMVSPVLGAIGAVASIVSTFQGDREEERRRERELLDSQARLIRALEDLENAVLTGTTTAERDRILGTARAADTFNHLGLINAMKDPRKLADLQRLEELTGITFMLGDGRVDMDAFRAAIQALAEMDMAGFGDDLTGQLDRIDWLFSTLGDSAGDAADQIEMLLDALRTTGNKDFAKQLQDLLASGGTGAVIAFLDELAKRFAAGDESLFAQGGAFFGMTRDEALRFLEEMRSAAQGGGVIGGGSNVQRLAVSITEAQGSQVVSLLGTMVHHLAGIHARVAGHAVPLSGLPGTVPPSTAAVTSGAGSSTVLNVDVDVELHGVGDVTEASAQVLGKSIASDVAEQISISTREKWRGAGRLGSPSVTGGAS